MTVKTKQKITEQIKAEAKRLGFLDCGISAARKLENEEAFYKDWLVKGYNAQMDYLSNNLDKRLDPTLLVPNSKSVISVSLNYYWGEIEHKKNHPRISKYALGRDYHKVMKKMLKQLFTYIQTLVPNTAGRFFVDSAPVLDKTWAEKSGLGWRGKNSLIISKDKGSFFFIGEIISNLELEYDKPISSYCGDCRLCIEACPTNAIIEEYSLDANKCISYQTIENKEVIPLPIITNLKDYIYGCDICQDVCPWNSRFIITNIADFGSKKDLLNLSYSDYHKMTEEEFNTNFNGTAIKRTGFNKIQQTVNQIIQQ